MKYARMVREMVTSMGIIGRGVLKIGKGLFKINNLLGILYRLLFFHKANTIFKVPVPRIVEDCVVIAFCEVGKDEPRREVNDEGFRHRELETNKIINGIRHHFPFRLTSVARCFVFRGNESAIHDDCPVWVRFLWAPDGRRANIQFFCHFTRDCLGLATAPKD
jgi:hypothetical protein